ncbi:hypothetical protein SAMN00808754_2871 [Thermanaeromonas toyohensis ToBE]|uniref:Uncharacterized protein n=1 Tax=Thermanaeromonas toyohensis ToBE TaxID=698762 RepID=A0A1W1W192_9FIRM|nr:hypothetical protein [Thermanaeromonas toyohensis]SMB99368.1 hypothetical protein SAMN00808754_2871 [Thermanaeromonas toyohensis ToBE]
MKSRGRLDKLLANLPANLPPQLMGLRFSPALRERVQKRVAQLMDDQAVKVTFPLKKDRRGVLIAVAMAVFFFAILSSRWILFSRGPTLVAEPISSNLKVEEAAWLKEPLRRTRLPTPASHVPIVTGEDTVIIPLEVLPLPHGQGAIIWIVYQQGTEQHYYYLLLHFEEGKAQPISFERGVTSKGVSTSN